jgi:hypothetical protein
MVTVANAGALSTPRLSVTTSEKVTVPVVLGTVTATLAVGAVVVVDGFDGVSATGVPVGAGVGGMLLSPVEAGHQLCGCTRVH